MIDIPAIEGYSDGMAKHTSHALFVVERAAQLALMMPQIANELRAGRALRETLNGWSLYPTLQEAVQAYDKALGNQ